MVAVSYHDTVEFLQGPIAPGEYRQAGPFDRVEWFRLLAEGGISPLLVEASKDGECLALPLTRTDSGFEPLVNWYSFHWRPVMRCDGLGTFLLVAAAKDLRRQSHRVTLWPLPDEDGTASRLQHAFREAGWHVERSQCDHNHILHVDGRSFAEYWAARPGAMRTTLKRKAKKVAVELFDRFDPAAWAAYEHIYASSWKPEEGNPALLRQFAQAEGAAGRLRLGIARHEGIAVAAQFWTVENGAAYIHKLAHLEEYKALSAGTTLSAAMFEQTIDRDRVTLIDFGTGNDAYKTDWMEEARPRYRLECLDPAQPRAWPVLARRMAARLARAFRQS
ncbi:GNAT family N-acetyltransferase [Allopontixanthobacter sp.]|uniref:GNAT family N-acetyltransferase n=1 Tax=Allopontixanthobacter sp. TaxID=2906452 RepID=UPI002ABB27E9|nr:GNAT family N-acetyltransferase [Allopontixanthobacter sp.]MDZ4308066.1 GNAT family N-acetyltransferase [Allopontixanthobacter sp.]